MYRLDPAAVYTFPELLDDPVCAARIERMLGACDRSPSDLKLITPETLGEAVSAITALAGTAPRTRALVFARLNTGVEPEPDWDELLARCPEGTGKYEVQTMYGFARNIYIRSREGDQKANHVCWCAYEFNTVWGCSHGCQYCSVGRGASHLVIGVNNEDYAERVARQALIDYPWQKCYRLIGGAADQITLEPEYGMYEALGKVFAEYDDRYIITHTASDNVCWMKDLPYADRFIHVYSLTSDDYAEALEPDTPTPQERLRAAAFVEGLGLQSRPKLKPIIPLRNWREDYARLIDDLFATTKPQSIGLCVMMWMNLQTAKQFLDLETLDPVFAQRMVEQEETMKGEDTGPFDPESRKEIYRYLIGEIRRHDHEVPVYISTETREMWDELAPELGQNPKAFICGCGPMATPDGKLTLSAEQKYTTYCPTPN